MKNMDALRARGAKLSKVTDDLNQAIRTSEFALQKLGLGVRARVELYTRVLDDDGDTGLEVTTWLAFGKLDGKWRLLVETDRPDHDDSTEQPLVNASREDRLCASRKLADLLDAMTAVIDREIAEVEEALRRVDSFLLSVQP